MPAKASLKQSERSPEADRKNLDLAISGINKQYGSGALMRLGEAAKMEVDVISSGSIAIDLALGAGGLRKVVSVKSTALKALVRPLSVSAASHRHKKKAATQCSLTSSMRLTRAMRGSSVLIWKTSWSPNQKAVKMRSTSQRHLSAPARSTSSLSTPSRPSSRRMSSMVKWATPPSDFKLDDESGHAASHRCNQ